MTSGSGTIEKGSAREKAPDDGALDLRGARRGRAWRRAGIGLLVAIIALNFAGVIGQRTHVVRASANGYSLSVTYPAVVRPGLDVRWEIRVTAAAGFGKQLSIAMDRHYFDIFDLNSVRPDADSATSNGDMIVYTWSAPPARTFTFSFDAMAEYGEHIGLTGRTAVIVDGRQAVAVTYSTRWIP